MPLRLGDAHDRPTSARRSSRPCAISRSPSSRRTPSSGMSTSTSRARRCGRAGELGLGGIYVREDVGGSGLSRSDAAAIFEELAKADPSIAAYISIHNMVAWMIDTYGTDEQRHDVAAAPDRDDRLRQLLPHRAGRGLGCRGASRPARSATADDDYVLTGVKQFISGGGEASVYVVMARTGEPGARGIIGVPRARRRRRPLVRREREEDGLERPADAPGDPRRGAGAGIRPARRRGPGLQDRDVGPQRRPRQHRRVLARRGAVGARPGAAATCTSATRSASRSPRSRPSCSRSPTWRPSCAPRGRSCGMPRSPSTRRRRMPRCSARWPSASRPTPASASRTRRCSCTAATATCTSTASRRSSATCGCTRSSRARTRSCASSSAASCCEAVPR